MKHKILNKPGNKWPQLLIYQYRKSNRQSSRLKSFLSF